MRISTMAVGLAVGLVALPAYAQLGVNLGGQAGVGVNVGVDTRPVLDNVRGTLDRTVDSADRTVNRALDTELEAATRADISSGAVVRDSRGRRVGTVQSVSAEGAILVAGGRQLQVPLGALYRSGTGLVTTLSRAQLNASARADANADSSVRKN